MCSRKSSREMSGKLRILWVLLVALPVLVAGGAAGDLLPEEVGVCARVRIKISQEVALTRTAFRATLEVNNLPENVALEQVLVALDITDLEDRDARDRFGIRPPELTGISDVNGTGTIQPGSTARAVWTIIPNREAAPDQPTDYFIGGLLEYRQGDAQVSIPLFPARITVRPDPLLYLDYFLVRDVYSDDPFTPQIEPAEPFPLGLLMTNRGKGVARNVRITSSQPEIIDNEKGLLIDFKIIGTQVNTSMVSPSLSVNLGDLEPGKTAVARWMMTSTLQGRFVEYKATFEHIDGLGDPRLSLIDSVNIHELNHAVRVEDPADDHKPDFLVNSIPDPDRYPDTLFNSDGTTAPVNVGLNQVIDGFIYPSKMQAMLTAIVPSGFVYIRAEEPGQERYRLRKVLRSDGREIRLDDNAWTTHRTIRLVGQPVRREHKLHIFDYNSTGQYTLIYEQIAAGEKSIGEARLLPDGAEVELGGTEGVAVTGLFEDGMYVASLDRTSGIRVTGIGAFEGERVNVTGTLDTDVNGERVIRASRVVRVAAGTVEPLVTNLRALHSGDFFYDPVTGSGQKGMAGGAGLNAIGLFVKVTGLVAGAAADSFVLGEGAGKYDLKVLLPEGAAAPPAGSVVTVKALVSCERDGDVLRPVLRPRREGDIFPENTGPIISNVQVSNVTATGASIVWSTDRQSSSQVLLGTASGNYTRTVDGPDFVTGHIVNLTGLTPDTTYFFVVRSRDYYTGIVNTSEEYSFRTPAAVLPSFTLDFPVVVRSGASVTATAQLGNTGGTATQVRCVGIQVSPASVGIDTPASEASPLAFGNGNLPMGGTLQRDLQFTTDLASFFVKLTLRYRDSGGTERTVVTSWKKVNVP